MAFWDRFAPAPSSEEPGTSSLQPWQRDRRDRFSVIPGVDIDFMDDAVYDLGRGINNYILEPVTSLFNPAEDASKTFLGSGRTTEGANYSPMWGSANPQSQRPEPEAPPIPQQTWPGVGAGPGGSPARSQYVSALEDLAAGAGAGAAPAGVGDLGAMRQQIDDEYGGLLGRLDQMYQLAETPQERAMIQFALEDLSDQYRAAQESIGMVFDAADQQIGQYADDAAAQAAGVGDMVRAEYDEGIERSMQQEAMARALLGDQFGEGYAASVRGNPDRAALDAALMEGAGTRESTYRQGMADMSAEDAAWLEAQQGTLRSANTAEASRINAALRSQAIQEHDRRVSDRINAERMQRAQAEQQLIQQKLAQQAQLASQEAQMRAAAQQSGQSSRLAALQALVELEGEGGLGGGMTFGNLNINPVDGRVGPSGAWDEGTFRNILYNYQSAAQSSPEDLMSLRQQALDSLLQRAPAAEGAQAALYEGWLNDVFDQITPAQYRPFVGDGGGGYTITAQNAPRGGR